MKLHKESVKSLLQFAVLSLAIFFASSLPDSITASPKKQRLIPRMLRGDFTVSKVLKSFDGVCESDEVAPFINESVTITTKRDMVSLHGRSTMTAEITRRGKYRAQLVKLRAGSDQTKSESLKGKFKFNRKLKRVSFKGNYFYDQVNADQTFCSLQYQVKLLPVG